MEAAKKAAQKSKEEAAERIKVRGERITFGCTLCRDVIRGLCRSTVRRPRHKLVLFCFFALGVRWWCL